MCIPGRPLIEGFENPDACRRCIDFSPLPHIYAMSCPRERHLTYTFSPALALGPPSRRVKARPPRKPPFPNFLRSRRDEVECLTLTSPAHGQSAPTEGRVTVLERTESTQSWRRYGNGWAAKRHFNVVRRKQRRREFLRKGNSGVRHKRTDGTV